MEEYTCRISLGALARSALYDTVFEWYLYSFSGAYDRSPSRVGWIINGFEAYARRVMACGWFFCGEICGTLIRY